MTNTSLWNVRTRRGVFFYIVAVSAITYVTSVALSRPRDSVWSAIILLWVIVISMSLRRIADRPAFLLFNLTFGLFLLARPLLQVITGDVYVDLASDANTHVQLTLLIGLSGVFLSYMAAERICGRHQPQEVRLEKNSVKHQRRLSILAVSWPMFVITWPAVLLNAVLLARSASQLGYTSIYTLEVRGASGILGSMLGYLALVNFAALVVFLAANVSKSRFYIAIFLAALPEGIAMLAGTRGGFGTLMLVAAIYVVFRARGRDPEFAFSKHELRVGISALLILPVTFVWVDRSRSGEDLVSVSGPLDTIVDFLENQGVSLTVLSNGYTYAGRIPDQPYLLEFLFRGPLRGILGGQTTSGNSIINATEGTSFGHALSYVLMGPEYLLGRGTGSSFLAEGFADLGYWGVLVVAVVFGFLLQWLDRFGSGVLADSIRLLIFPSVLLAPRGSATQFLSVLTNPITVVAIAAIFLLAGSARARGRQKKGGGRAHAVSNSHPML